MKTLQEKYTALLEGEYSKAEFVRDARKEFSSIITKFNSAEDAIQILKNKGVLTEEATEGSESIYPNWKPEYQQEPAFNASLYQTDLGIRVELAEMGVEGIPTQDEYFEAREKAIKNLSKNIYFYTSLENKEEEEREDTLQVVDTDPKSAEDLQSTNQMEKVNEVLAKFIEKAING